MRLQFVSRCCLGFGTTVLKPKIFTTSAGPSLGFGTTVLKPKIFTTSAGPSLPDSGLMAFDDHLVTKTVLASTAGVTDAAVAMCNITMSDHLGRAPVALALVRGLLHQKEPPDVGDVG
jgi:hypothetical protein